MQRIATSCSLKVVPRQQQHLVKVNLWRCNRHHPMRTLLQLHRPAPLTTTTSTPHHVGRPIPAISCRCYTRVIYQYPSKKGGNGNGDTSHDIPEILPQTSSKTRPIVVRFLNPWVDLSNVTDDAVLAQKVDSVTRTFGVVAGLMCSLSAAALAVIPSADEEHTRGNSGISSGKNRDDLVKESQSKSAKANENNCSTGVVKGAMIRRQNTKSMYSPNGQQVSGTSLLATIGGLSSKELADIYAACCAGSFYSSVCAMGLSAVLNAWLACTPAGGTKCECGSRLHFTCNDSSSVSSLIICLCYHESFSLYRFRPT